MEWEKSWLTNKGGGDKFWTRKSFFKAKKTIASEIICLCTLKKVLVPVPIALFSGAVKGKLQFLQHELLGEPFCPGDFLSVAWLHLQTCPLQQQFTGHFFKEE
jgi:hypothetical protein